MLRIHARAVKVIPHLHGGKNLGGSVVMSRALRLGRKIGAGMRDGAITMQTNTVASSHLRKLIAAE